MNRGAIMPLEGKMAGVDRGQGWIEVCEQGSDNAIRRQSIRGG